MRMDLRADHVEAALMGGHGCAVSVMLALGAAELEAAATEGDEPTELANFWYFPGDFRGAVAAADAVGLDGEPVLNALARLALTYREDSGEVLFRLACHHLVLTARGAEWEGLSPARRRAWELFAGVANRVYSVLEGAEAEAAAVLPPPAVPAVAETIFDEDRESDVDQDRLQAVDLIAAADAAAAEPSEPVATAPADGDLLSIAMPPQAVLPAEADDAGIKKGDRVWRELDGQRAEGTVLTAHRDGRYRVDVDGIEEHATWDPAEAPVTLITPAA